MSPRDHFRAHGRMAVQIDALLRHQDASAPVTIRNLGFGGAGLEIAQQTALELVTGDQVTIEIIAPVLWDPLHLHGTLVWTKSSAAAKSARVGVRFDPLSRTPLLSLFDVLCSV